MSNIFTFTNRISRGTKMNKNQSNQFKNKPKKSLNIALLRKFDFPTGKKYFSCCEKIFSQLSVSDFLTEFPQGLPFVKDF